MKLSEKLSNYRTDRPSEWTMDEFNRDALELEKQLQQYKSIVKTVDAEALPISGVFIITKQKTIKFGAFDIRGLFFDENFNKHKPAHYIEQKDLLKFFVSGEVE